MRIRIWLGLLPIVAIAVVQPPAHASHSRGAPVKKIATPRSSGKTILPRRGKPAANGFKRKTGPTDEVAPHQKATGASRPAGRASIARNVGWGAFFATLGTVSAARGAVAGAIIFAGATAYNAVKGWLISKRGATVAQADSIAFNSGWGTFWSGIGVHGAATGNPLAAAIGLGAGAYNLYKAGRGYRALAATTD